MRAGKQVGEGGGGWRGFCELGGRSEAVRALFRFRWAGAYGLCVCVWPAGQPMDHVKL